jgi:large subunit ribosomal protein L35
MRENIFSADDSGARCAAFRQLRLAARSAITPASRRPASQGCRGGGDVHKCPGFDTKHTRSLSSIYRPVKRSRLRAKESQMPKIKTKSGAKKRFKVTGSGKVMYAQRGKRHGMIKRTKKQIRQLRGTNVLFKTDGDNIKKYFLPNG